MKVRFGIIGTGSIADDCHAPAIQVVEGAILSGVLSRNENTAASFLQRHSAPLSKIHTSLERLANDPDIDCVIIASPDRLHAEQARACLAAGKDVLIEKPMAVSREEAAEIAKLAKEKQKIAAVGFHLRHHNGHRALFDAIKRDKAIGELKHIKAIWAFPQNDNSNWRAHEELGKWWSLAAVGSHCIDIARWFAQNTDEWREFKPVIGREKWNSTNDESADIKATFSNGITAEISSSVLNGPYNCLEIYGTNGEALCEGTFGRKGEGSIQIKGKDMAFKVQSPFINQLMHFMECVRTRKAPYACSAAGLRNVEDLLLAIDQ